MSSVYQRKVSVDEADIRLDRWFRRHFPQLPHALIERLCRTGQVRVDGRRVTAAARLSPGQSVRIPPLSVAVPPPPVPRLVPDAMAELESMLLYRDDYLFILNKPPGLPTQGGPGISRHLDGMLAAFADANGERPRLVHRLDRDTSGVLVVARTPGIAGKLAAAFRSRVVEKVYWAVVAGRPVPVAGRIDLMLSRHNPSPSGARVSPAALDAAEALPAITDYRTLDHAGRRFAWLELRPRTGRTHQLRVHCAAIGAPILGDAAYGGRVAGKGAALPKAAGGMLHLHARRLELPHPAGGMLVAEADLPAHMAATYRALGFSAPVAEPTQRR